MIFLQIKIIHRTKQILTEFEDFLRHWTPKKYAHTINGSGLAVGRTLIALLENNYEGSDSIKLPKALHTYFGASSVNI